MKMLVTAGNTLTPIDKVRCITNIFTGRTGTRIAVEANARGHDVTLLTSHPEVVDTIAVESTADRSRCWHVAPYRTFDDLDHLMAASFAARRFDVVVHCAAISDYRYAGIFAPATTTHFREESSIWMNDAGGNPVLIDRSAGKVKSDEQELWLRLVRTPKLVDKIRGDWKFTGYLVKFKLEVGVDDRTLLAVAEKSRVQSQADLMVANTLEGMGDWAFLGPLEGAYQKIERVELAGRLLDVIERK